MIQKTNENLYTVYFFAFALHTKNVWEQESIREIMNAVFLQRYARSAKPSGNHYKLITIKYALGNLRVPYHWPVPLH